MISRQGVTRVAAQNHSQELSLPYPAEMSLRLQKQGGRLLSGLEIVLEQQNSWQRGGEVKSSRVLWPACDRMPATLSAVAARRPVRYG